MLLRLLLTVVLVSTVAASIQAQTSRDAGISSIADLDSAVDKVLSPTPQESREAIDWLVRHRNRFAMDSPLEGNGFEPLVPRKRSGTESSQTLCWREMYSNHRSPVSGDYPDQRRAVSDCGCPDGPRGRP